MAFRLLPRMLAANASLWPLLVRVTLPLNVVRHGVAGRVTREEIEARWPRLLGALRSHPGIGFVVVGSAAHGGVVLGADGELRLESGDVLGDAPLAPFGPHAWAAAFEELVGSHGGLGGTQAHPFVLAPAGRPWPEEAVVGAESVHRILRGWLGAVGHAAYRQAVER